MKLQRDWSAYRDAGVGDAYADIPNTGGDFARAVAVCINSRHCHQEAVGAMKSMRKVLKAIPGLKLKLIDSSCCGMAGSFGIEAEHAALSMEMAEQSLLPALREQPRARVLANGFSCRHQIREGADRPAVHLAVLLRESMAAAGVAAEVN